MKKAMLNARRILAALFFIFVSTLAFGQGATTSEINGRVIAAGGESLPGATVLVVHTPTGTRTGTTTNIEGYFRLPNLNVGGPYEVTISFIGYQTYFRNDIYLSLGQSFKINAKLTEGDQKIDEVIVVAKMVGDYQVFDGNRTGSETVVSREDIDEMPSVSGNLNDFLRLTPQASSNGDGMTIAGMNNRFNSLMIDGTVNNDVFGLSASGMNGGQSGVSPISIEAIEQIQVVIAPFDVRQGGFAGGGINAVTKSGTNQFKGMLYHKFRNEKLAGKTPTYRLDDESRERLDEFTAKTTGFSLGGPIIKNKLFFFVNAEKRKDETPQPFAFSEYKGNSDAATIKQVQDQFRSYGYEPGGYKNNVRSLEGEKFLVKLNWNINANHRLMLRHQYTKGESFSPSRSNPKSINFYNSGVFFPSTTNASAIELKSRFGQKYSNSLKIGYTTVHDDRDPLGGNFPTIAIKDGSGTIKAGSEAYSTGNELKQKILTITDNFQIYKGAHTITLGTHNEFYDIYNLFMRRAYGSYTFNSVADFVAENPSESRLGFSLVDNVSGDGSAAAADFNFYQLGFYAQDEWQVNNNFKLTAGVRVDIPIFNDQPLAVEGFNSTTVPELEKQYDLKGARAGKMPSNQVMWSPRVGFNWDVNGKGETQVRGGVGIFTSRIPFVWPAGSYTNNGMMQGDYSLKAKYGDDVNFVPEWNNQPKPSGASAPKGSQIDIYAKDFKFPQVLRANIGVDQQLPWGVVGTFEVLYTKILNNALWKDVNIKPAIGNATGTPDNRPLYKTYKNGIDSQYGQIMLGDNTSKGYTYNLTAQFRKDFDFGLGASIAYNYGQAKSIFDGTSSQNSSQWNYLVSSPTPRNEAELGYSGFDQGHRIVGSLTYSKEYLKHLKTSVGLFYSGQSGKRFSYIYNDYGGSFTNEAYKGPQLIYVPGNKNEIVLGDRDGAFDKSSAEFNAMWTELDAYIDQDDYLSERRGKYAEKNGSRLPWENIFDLKITQDLFVNVADRKQTLQLGIDIFNVGNMINKDWGRMYYASKNNISLIKFEGMADDGTTPIMSFERPDADKPYFGDDSGLTSSRWQAQVSIKYIF